MNFARDFAIYLNSGTPTAASTMLPLSGGTMTGDIVIKDRVRMTDGSYTTNVVQMIDEGSSNGDELTITANGNTFIGAGESANNLRSALADGTSSGESYGSGNEQMYVCSDNNIYFYSTCNTIANRTGIVLDTSGYLRPLVTNTRYLGSSSYYWAREYVQHPYWGPVCTVDVNGATSGYVGIDLASWSGRKISLQIGSGGDNRGIYDNEQGCWLLYADANNNVLTGYTNTNYTTYQLRKIAFTTFTPSSLTNGNICMVYS